MRSRRSVRHFTERSVEPEKIERILEAGRYSPTGSNRQDVSYVILGSRQKEAEAICVELFRKGTSLPSRVESFAESLGLGVLYSGFFVLCTKLSRKLRKLIGIPMGSKVVTCMVIGYPAVKYQRIVPRKPLKSKTL